MFFLGERTLAWTGSKSLHATLSPSAQLDTKSTITQKPRIAQKKLDNTKTPIRTLGIFRDNHLWCFLVGKNTWKMWTQSLLKLTISQKLTVTKKKNYESKNHCQIFTSTEKLPNWRHATPSSDPPSGPRPAGRWPPCQGAGTSGGPPTGPPARLGQPPCPSVARRFD